MNFTGDHPLNLIGKVAIVTSASSLTGAATCRFLLNSNTLVLGVDSDAAHASTRSTLGSHFQFLRFGGKCHDEDAVVGARALEAVRLSFDREAVDFLVNVVVGNGWGETRMKTGMGMGMEGWIDVLDGMAARRRGMVLFVSVGNEREEEIIESARKDHSQLKSKGIRFNVLVDHTVGHNSKKDSMIDQAAKVALQKHIHEHDLRRKAGGYIVEREREIGNLALFLCTSLGQGIDGALIGIDGSYAPL